MRVTESEAKKMVCPMGMSYGGDVFLRCHGSGCMVWLWDPADNNRFCNYFAEPRAVAEPAQRPDYVGAAWEWVPYDEEHGQFVAGWREPDDEVFARRMGVCGMVRR